MNAVTRVAPPLTAIALGNVLGELPAANSLSEADFSYLVERAHTCLRDVDGVKSERSYAETKVAAFVNGRTFREGEKARLTSLIRAWRKPLPEGEAMFRILTTPDCSAWHELLVRAAPLIADEADRRAVEETRRAAERVSQLAENDRRVAERERREREEAKEVVAAALRAESEARKADRPFKVVRASSLAGQAVPATRWLVPRWLPVGCATVLYGMPGTGKTLLAQMLATSCATGRPWLGQEVEQCNAFALFCEDDDSVIHGRQADINARMDVDFAGLDNLTWSCPVGQDNTLMRFPKSGDPETTDYFDHLREQMLDEKTRLLILDTASVVFGGDPNDRNDVTAFLGQLTSLARDMDGAVLLNTHPSQSAMSSGGGLGHSVAWLGSARAVWRLDGRGGQGRTLTRTKSNLSSTGEQVKLWMRDGVLDTSAADANAECVFLALLRQMEDRGEKVSAKETARNFAPAVFAKDPGRRDFGRDALRVAMDRLLASGSIKSESYGKPSQGFTRLTIATADTED